MRKLVATTLLLFTASLSLAGPLSDVFGDGVLNAKWGDSPDQVLSAHPNGKLKSYGGVWADIIEIKDGRAVFSVERKKDDPISFGFDSEKRFVGAAITFSRDDSFALLVNKLNTLFGQLKIPDGQEFPNYVWEDDKIKLQLVILPATGLFSLSPSVMVSIQYKVLEKPKVSKGDLGL